MFSSKIQSGGGGATSYTQTHFKLWVFGGTHYINSSNLMLALYVLRRKVEGAYKEEQTKPSHVISVLGLLVYSQLRITKG